MDAWLLLSFMGSPKCNIKGCVIMLVAAALLGPSNIEVLMSHMDFAFSGVTLYGVLLYLVAAASVITFLVRAVGFGHLRFDVGFLVSCMMAACFLWLYLF